MASRTGDTREEIVRLGMEFIQTYGYNAFSYADIAKKLNIKNAAVHYHFPGKEDLLIEIVGQYIQRYHDLARALEAPGLTSRKRIQAFIDRYTTLCDQGKICLIGSVGSDYFTMPETVKKKLGELVELVLGMVEGVLRDGKKKGEFSFPETPRVRALLMMTNLAAGVQLARITGQKDYKAICNSLVKQLADT
ncbi:MAG: TetR/AcrR family transcriptional regulator [Chitinophagales bacterium]|nr:TetR/AcrR family transcriptional regulator [Chitinophagales bacterium]